MGGGTGCGGGTTVGAGMRRVAVVAVVVVVVVVVVVRRVRRVAGVHQGLLAGTRCQAGAIIGFPMKDLEPAQGRAHWESAARLRAR